MSAISISLHRSSLRCSLSWTGQSILDAVWSFMAVLELHVPFLEAAELPSYTAGVHEYG